MFFLVFASNAKSFAIAFLFAFCVCVLTHSTSQMPFFFFSVFCVFVLTPNPLQLQLFLFSSLQQIWTDCQKLVLNFFFYSCSGSVWRISDLLTSIPCPFMPCALEIESNGGLKRACEILLLKHEKHISTTAMPIATDFGRVVTYHKMLPPIKSHDPTITWSCRIT